MPRGNPGKPKSEQHRQHIAAAAKLRATRSECLAQLKVNGKKSTPALVAGNRERALPIGVAGKRDLQRRYKYDANQRNLVWALTDADFEKLVTGYCHYCGDAPAQSKGAFMYNGIDRQNNTVGYKTTNCVTCCGRCNWWKSTMSQEEFYNHVGKIYRKQQALSLAVGE